MRSQIRLWSVKDGELKQLPQVSFSNSHKEKDLEDWVKTDPTLLGRDLTIIGKQIELPNAGILDLLAIDDNGRLVVIEFKRHTTTRDAIAQILDYASAIRLLTAENLTKLPGLHLDSGSEITDFDPSMILVAEEADEKAERIVDYLASKAQLSIEVVTFTYALMANGEEILARSILIPDPIPTAKPLAAPTTVAEILAIAAERNITDLVDVFRRAESLDWWPESLPIFGGTLRYWVTVPNGKSRAPFGLNVGGGKLNTPTSALDIWFNPETIADYTGASEEQIWKDLDSFPPQKSTNTQLFMRITEKETAEKVLQLLKQWHQKYLEVKLIESEGRPATVLITP
jgi:hypothetical protein